MEEKSVFEFRNYKAFLKYLENNKSKNGRGFRADLARAAGCQTAYVSQVLNGKANFSLDQSHSLNRLLLHNKAESRYFLLLVEHSRAGTIELRKHLLEEMEDQIQRQLNLKERFKVKESLSEQDQMIYYSEWIYAAIHIAVTIINLQSSEAITQFLQIPKQKTEKILKFLTSVGLITKMGSDKYEIGTSRLHVGRDSVLLSKHHTNWRLQAINSLEREGEKDLHYTSIVSLSQTDVLEIKSRLVKEIESFNAIVKDSKEETLCCLALDFFSLNRTSE
jgi:uncharacterized protein (TIGR02147 family)